MAIPAINFLWLETELDLDAFIPRDETFSEISPVVIVGSWEWAHWDSPWINCVLPVIYAPAQTSKLFTNDPGLRRGWFAASDTLETVQKCFPAAPVVGKSCSALGSTKQKFLLNLPFFGSAWMCEHPSISTTRSKLWAGLGYTSQSLFLLSRRHQTLEKQQVRWDLGVPAAWQGDHRERNIIWGSGIKGQMEFRNWRRLEREI